MLSALGHCEDSACVQSSSAHEVVRLFRCSIHCDRLLCLFHLNAHNILYEEEKKQTDAILQELQNSLTHYQRIFEQHIQSYRELVHQASTLLLHNTSSIIPIEQIRPVLEKLQTAIAIFQYDKVIIKNDGELDTTCVRIEKIDSNLSKDISPVKKEIMTPKNSCVVESNPRIVVRLERIQFDKEMELGHKLVDAQINRDPDQRESTKDEISRKLKDSINDMNGSSISDHHDEDVSHGVRLRKRTDENEQPNNKRHRTLSPNSSATKQSDRIKKKNDKIVSGKRLQA